MDAHPARRSPVTAIVSALVILLILAGLFTWLEDEDFLKVLLWIGVPLGFWSIYSILTLDEDQQDQEPSGH